MPISRNRLVLSTLSFLALGLLALAAIVITNIVLARQTSTYIEEVSRVRQLRAAVADFRSLLQDAETGQRGYLLTGEETYLQPFRDTVANFEAQSARLTAAAAFSDAASERVAGLISTAQEKLDELSRTVALAQAGQHEQAIEIVRTDRGKALMDEARAAMQIVISRSEVRLTELEKQQLANADALWWVSLIGGGVVLLVTAGALGVIFSYLRQLARNREEIEELNAGLETRVQERTAELAQANEEIQRFAYIVTHDLRAPLVNIMGFTSELEQNVAALQTFVERSEADEADADYQAARLAAQEDVPEALRFIRSSTRKMDGLINAILKLSREGRRELRPERLDLNVLLNNAAATVAHQISEADGEIDLDVKVPSLVADRMSVEQMVGNLLDNAVKYRRPGVPLKISVRALGKSGGFVEISVADNGRGIEKQDHERVFELFRRSGQQNQPGEGIGLAHVRTMARNLGGDVLLNSTFGEGSVFTLRLPAVVRARARSMAA